MTRMTSYIATPHGNVGVDGDNDNDDAHIRIQTIANSVDHNHDTPTDWMTSLWHAPNGGVDDHEGLPYGGVDDHERLPYSGVDDDAGDMDDDAHDTRTTS